MGEKKAYEQWKLARDIYGKDSPEERKAKNVWHKALTRNYVAREGRKMIAEMCGTSYAAAKRDMGL